MTEDSEDLFNLLLPDDCLVEILMYLPFQDRMIASQVCRRWQHVSALASRLVKKFKYNEDTVCSTCTRHVISTACRQCNNLTKFSLDIQKFENKKLPVMLKTLQKLQSLTIKGMTSSNRIADGLQELPKTLKIIKLSTRWYNLNLSRKFTNVFENFNDYEFLALNRINIPDSLATDLGQKKKLRHLDLAGCNLLDGFFFMPNFNKLEYLNLSYAVYESNTMIINIANGCVNLKHLNLSRTLASEQALNELLKLQKLEELIVRHVEEMTDTLIAKWIKLKILDCTRCLKITNNGIKQLLRNSLNLEHLIILRTKITPEIFAYAARLTKFRGQNLRISVSSSMAKCLKNQEIQSPYLTVEVKSIIWKHFHSRQRGTSDSYYSDSDESPEL